MIKRILSTALFVLATSATMLSQNVALKTNALYWATTTPNLGIEASVGKKSIIRKTKCSGISEQNVPFLKRNVPLNSFFY